MNECVGMSYTHAHTHTRTHTHHYIIDVPRWMLAQPAPSKSTSNTAAYAFVLPPETLTGTANDYLQHYRPLHRCPLEPTAADWSQVVLAYARAESHMSAW